MTAIETCSGEAIRGHGVLTMPRGSPEETDVRSAHFDRTAPAFVSDEGFEDKDFVDDGLRLS